MSAEERLSIPVQRLSLSTGAPRPARAVNRRPGRETAVRPAAAANEQHLMSTAPLRPKSVVPKRDCWISAGRRRRPRHRLVARQAVRGRSARDVSTPSPSSGIRAWCHRPRASKPPAATPPTRSHTSNPARVMVHTRTPASVVPKKLSRIGRNSPRGATPTASPWHCDIAAKSFETTSRVFKGLS